MIGRGHFVVRSAWCAMRSAAAIVARGQGAGTIAPDLGVAGGPAGPELLGHTFDRPALDDPLVFEQLPTKTVTRAQRPAATASDRRGYPTPHTLSSGVRWSTASSIITGRDTHPWTRKAGQGVDSPGSEVRSAPAERAVGLSGALSRSASAIRVPGCIAGHEVGLSPRPGIARHEVGLSPRPGLARHEIGAGPLRSDPAT